MDITSFSDDNFDTKAWINNILQSETQDKKENYTMSLVMKLQLYVQQVNNALEETSQHVLSNLPKIMRDTSDLQEEALILKGKMAAVKEEIIKIEEDTGKSIDSIEKLDRAKTRLYEAKQGLHESDNWTVLVNDLEEAFDSKNVEIISTKILSMQASLKLLVNVSDYEERKLQLEGLKNRLEAIASPFIVQSFTSKLIDQSISYAKIFYDIGRFEQLLKYFKNCQRDELLKKWRSQLEEDDKTVVDWIHNYFDYLLSNWHTQYKWLSLVFPSESPTYILIDIYIDVLTNLDPSMVECIDANMKQVSEKLMFIHEIKQIIKQFATNLIGVVEITNQGKRHKSKHLPLLQAIYSPLVNYVSKYANYEKSNLVHQLSAIKCIKEELPDTIQALGFSVPAIMDLARDSKKRCQEITEFCGYCGMLIALRAFFVTYADQYRVALRQIDRNKGKDEDWNSFQLCLSLLQNTGEVLHQLNQFEKELTSTVLEINTLHAEDRIEYKYLMLDASERKEFEALIKCVMEGTKLSLLDHVSTEFNKLCSDIHYTTYQVVFTPISTQLDIIQNARTWQQFPDSQHQSDLPDYSFTPQEYITQIGLYLMTLPQHLEPFLFRENPSLICALRAADPEYNNANDAIEGAMAEVLLGVIAKGTCQGYCDRILSICSLSHSASRQLAHDISYLGNVLEDLGLSLTDNLQQLMMLLKIAPDQYQAQSSGCTARYVAAIRQMRNITSAG